MSDWFQTAFGHRLILLLVGCLAYGVNLGATRLWDVDEAIFSETAVEMMERGDWVTPYYNGHFFSHKPPFMYWCQIAAFQLFGQTEFAARLFSALFSVGSLIVTYEIGVMLFNRRAAFWGALSLAGFVHFAVIGRAATPDAHLTFFSTLTMFLLVKGTGSVSCHSNSNAHGCWKPVLPISRQTYFVAYCAMAVGTLVKGPVAVIIPMAVWGLFLLITQEMYECRNPKQKVSERICSEQIILTNQSRSLPVSISSPRDWRDKIGLQSLIWFICLFRPVNFMQTVWRMRPVTALLVFTVVAVPWYALVGWRTNGEFLREFFLVHNLGRASSAMEHHFGPPYYYVITIIIGTFPWCVLLWPALVHLAQSIKIEGEMRSGFILVACWAGVWIVCFTLVATKLSSYVVPAYPAIALCLGALIESWLTKSQDANYLRWFKRAWLSFAVAGLACLIIVPVVTQRLMDGEWTPALIGLVPLTGAIFGWCSRSQRQPLCGLMTIASMAILLSIGLLGFAAIPIDAHKNTHLLGESIHQHRQGRVHLATYKYSPPSLVYYSRLFFERLRSREAVADHFRRHGETAFLITTAEQLAKLRPSLPPEFEVLQTERMFLKLDRIVLFGKRFANDAIKHRELTLAARIPSFASN